MPTMTVPDKSEAEALNTAPRSTEPDDIPDPPVPRSLIEALDVPEVLQPPDRGPINLSQLHDQVLMTVDTALYKVTQHVLAGMSGLDKSISGGLQAIAAGQDGMRLLASALAQATPLVPFSGTVKAISPSGYPISLSAQGTTQDEFLQRFGALLGFLKTEGFTPPETEF